MGIHDVVRRFLGGEPTELFRRYFVNTLFDSTFVVLGILAAAAFVPGGGARLALGAIFAASLAIGISTGVSVYEAEHTEGEIRLDRLERAMLSPMRETQVELRIRRIRIMTSVVNFLTPLFVAAVTSLPILLFTQGWIGEFFLAASISTALAISIVFSAGFYLGTLSGRSPWVKALRMSLVAVLTFAGLVLLDRIT